MPRNIETLFVDDGPAQSLEPEYPLQPDQTLAPAGRYADAAASLGDTPPAGGSTVDERRLRSSGGGLPERFGDYEILAPVARGGMGMVYKARQVKLNRTVALKTILAGHLADESAVRRFYAEAEAAAALDHPNIVPIYEVGEHEGQHFFSMGLVEAGSLETFVADGPASDTEAARIMRGVAEAIAYAHERNIIHRDLKPANILLHKVAGAENASSGRAGDRSAAIVPKVTDFGIARRMDASSHLTATGQVLGTPSFMSPEQASGHAEQVGKPSDVFSLGAILYFLLTGRAPFDGETLIATLRNVTDADPVPPSRIRPSIGPELEAICLKSLEKDLSRRYGSARELADDLARFLAGGEVQARPSSTASVARRRPRRKPLVFAVAAGVLAAVLGGMLAVGRLAKTETSATESGATDARASDGGGAPGEASVERDAATVSANELRDALEEARREKHRAEEQEAALARERQELAHRSAYNLHLERAAHLVQTDPARAAVFLDDVQHFPAERREFTWRYLKRLASLASDPTTQTSVVQPSTPLVMTDGGHVVGVAFAPDGRTVAVGSTKPESIVRVYDLPSGRLRHTLDGHTEHVAFLGFAADSRKLFTCDGDVLRVWDTVSGGQRPQGIDQAAGVTALDCSPDGRELVTLGPDHVLRFWNIRSGRLVSSRRIAADHAGFTVAWTSQGTLLARVEGDHIRVVDAHSGDERFVVPSTADRVHSLLITGDARLLIVHEKKSLMIWRLDTAEMVADIPPQTIAVSPDSRSLAGIDEDGTVSFWDPWTGQVRASFPGHSAQGFLARFSRDGNYLLTTALDKSVRVWKAIPEGPTQGIPASLPFHPGG